MLWSSQGKSIDLTITPAVSPATDGQLKAVYSVQFRPATTGNSIAPVLVLAWPQVNGSQVSTGFDLAIQCAVAATGGLPNAVTLVGNVELDATA